MKKSECFKCPRCGNNQVSRDYVGNDLFHYNKDKPEGEQWESFVWFEFICMACDEEWSVKCDVVPVEIEAI